MDQRHACLELLGLAVLTPDRDGLGCDVGGHLTLVTLSAAGFWTLLPVLHQARMPRCPVGRWFAVANRCCTTSIDMPTRSTIRKPAATSPYRNSSDPVVVVETMVLASYYGLASSRLRSSLNGSGSVEPPPAMR
jgi:hypothetical protein